MFFVDDSYFNRLWKCHFINKNVIIQLHFNTMYWAKKNKNKNNIQCISIPVSHSPYFIKGSKFKGANVSHTKRQAYTAPGISYFLILFSNSKYNLFYLRTWHKVNISELSYRFSNLLLICLSEWSVSNSFCLDHSLKQT